MPRRRTAWLCIGLLTSIVLVLASCGTSSTSSTPSSVTTASQPSNTSAAPASTGYAQQTQTASTTKPKYGGTYNGFVTADTSNWDPGQKYDLAGWQISVGNEALMSGDWAKGPAGTDQADWMTSLNGNPTRARVAGYELGDPR